MIIGLSKDKGRTQNVKVQRIGRLEPCIRLPAGGIRLRRAFNEKVCLRQSEQRFSSDA